MIPITIPEFPGQPAAIFESRLDGRSQLEGTSEVIMSNFSPPPFTDGESEAQSELETELALCQVPFFFHLSSQYQI